MKNNLWISISAGAVALATMTGCLEKQEDANQPMSNRGPLIAALDNQAVSLVDSINKVVISGNFLANLSLENPPKPIPLEGDEDVKKAVDYFFANEVVSGTTSTYTPDPRICSEILAKENPATCQKIFAKVSAFQQVSDEDTGYVQIQLDGALPIGFVYDTSLVSFNVNLSELFLAIEKIEAVQLAAGEKNNPSVFPVTRNGIVTLTVANQMGASVVDLTIAQAVEIAGVTEDGQNYALNIPAANNVATLSLISALGIGTVSVNAPAATALIPVKDGQDVSHGVALTFPGASGQATLNNAMALIDLSALKLTSATVSASVDGQAAAQLNAPDQLNAQVIAAAGDITVQFSSAFSASLQTVSNALFDKNGSVTASIAQDSSLLFVKDANQAKVLNGTFSLIGSGDYSANMNAQAGMCIEGQDEPFYLETAVCQ